MANNLSTPPPPDTGHDMPEQPGPPAPSNPLQAAGQSMPAGGAPGMPQQGMQQQAPAPSHAQTVAALRHFDATRRTLEGLMKNPNIGKTDIKSAFIDGMVKMVSTHIMKPAEAVTVLASVPRDPQGQRKWVQTHYQATMKAEDTVLAQHAATAQSSGDFATDDASTPRANPDNHTDDMAGLMGHYKKAG